MWLREKHRNEFAEEKRAPKPLPCHVGKNQCDGAGWLSGATEERIIIVPLQKGQRNHGSKADDDCVHKVECLDRSTVGLHEPSKQ